MFERELRDSAFLKRWAIVRTLRDQSIAEHSFMVSMYVNDICIALKDYIDADVHLSALQYALWHDTKEEIFTGDLPGPNKRALMDDQARENWDHRLEVWEKQTFGNLDERMGFENRLGGKRYAHDWEIIKLIVKVADWLDAAMEMATEKQLGNGCTERHVQPNLAGAQAAWLALCKKLGLAPTLPDEVPLEPGGVYFTMHEALRIAVHSAEFGQSSGPWITQEDDTW